MLTALLDLLYPQRCRVCRTRGTPVLCELCRSDFAAVSPPFCPRCGCPRTGTADRCAPCRSGDVPFAVARSMALYEGRLRAAIHRLKFDGRGELGPILGDLLAAFVRQNADLKAPDLVVPVPLHPSREAERGYNHAALLALPVASALGVPLVPRALLRVALTAPQSELRRAARRRNVQGAFRVGRAVAEIRRKAVLLVDDVMTSGATAAECARTLLEAGADAVAVATLARAVPPRGAVRSLRSGAAGATGSRKIAPAARTG